MFGSDTFFLPCSAGDEQLNMATVCTTPANGFADVNAGRRPE